MIIECNTLTEFLDSIAGLVERGLTFHSNTKNLTINLTGGF